MTDADDLDRLAVAARAGDERAFGELVERLRPELVLHAYRMLASFDDAEEVVQESLLQAWRHLPSFEGRSRVRTWVYRITTNACLARRTRRHRRQRILAAGTVAEGTVVPLAMTVPWLQVCPDELLDRVAARQPDPAAAVATRETIEIAFVAALQHLPPRQGVAVVLRDALGWPAERAAEVVGVSVPAFNSALQRGRAGLRRLLGDEREDWSAAAAMPAGEDEASVLRRFVAAIEASDDLALLDLLDEHVVVGHQPGAGGNDTDEPAWYSGRATVIEAWAPALHHPVPLAMRMVPVAVNRQPAVATSIRLPGADHHQPFALNVFRIRAGRIVEVLTLGADNLALTGEVR